MMENVRVPSIVDTIAWSFSAAPCFFLIPPLSVVLGFGGCLPGNASPFLSSTIPLTDVGKTAALKKKLVLISDHFL